MNASSSSNNDASTTAITDNRNNDNNDNGDGGSKKQQQAEAIDISMLQINSRILLKNKDDDDQQKQQSHQDEDEVMMRVATIKKLHLNHTPPQLRVHVDGKRKGILDTIGLHDIHSIIGDRYNNTTTTAFRRGESGGSTYHSVASSAASDNNLDGGGDVAAASVNNDTADASTGNSHEVNDTKKRGKGLPRRQLPLRNNHHQQQLRQQQQQQQLQQKQPIITAAQYHIKFCLRRRNKSQGGAINQTSQQVQQHPPSSQQVTGSINTTNNITTNSNNNNRSTTSSKSDFTRRNNYNPDGSVRRMIMEDLLLMRQQQQQQQQQNANNYNNNINNNNYGGTPGSGGSSRISFGSSPFTYRDTSFPLPFMNSGGTGSGGVGGGGLIPPFHRSTTTAGGTAIGGISGGGDMKQPTPSSETITNNNNNIVGGMTLPPSAFSALDSLKPELRERMLRMSKLNDGDDNANDGSKGGEGKKCNDDNVDGGDNDAKIMREAESKSRTKKDVDAVEEESGDKDDDNNGVGEEKSDNEALSAKKKRKKMRSMTGKNDDRSSGGDSSTGGGGGSASLSFPSPAPFKPDFFGGRNPIMDPAALSGGSGGSGIGNFQDRMNMMQLMGMRPPPFGSSSGGGGVGGGLRPPFGDVGGGVSGGIRPPFGGAGGEGFNPSSSGLKRKFDPSISLDMSSAPPLDADARAQMMSALEGYKRIGNKFDSVGSTLDVPSTFDTTKFGSNEGSSKKKQKKTKKKEGPWSTEKKSGKKKKKKAKQPKSDEHEKPKRPFSAYNLFFQLEREFIMSIISSGGEAREDPLIKAAVEVVEEANARGEGKGKGTTVKMDDDKVKEAVGESNCEEIDLDMGLLDDGTSPPQINLPPRYKHLKLEDHWYCVSRKVKRKHRKTEGSCGFLELTKMISSRWKTIDCTDPQVKNWCQKVADKQLESYKKEVAEYKSWLASNADDDDEDSTQTDDSSSRAAQKPVSAGNPMPMGGMQQSFFDHNRLSDMGRFTDLSASQIRGDSSSMMPPLPPLQSNPPPPFSSLSFGARGIAMDETEHRFAALAEQESRRRLADEMKMSFMRPPPLGNGFGSNNFMGGVGDQHQFDRFMGLGDQSRFGAEAQRYLDRSSGMGGMGGFSSNNQGNDQLFTQMMRIQSAGSDQSRPPQVGGEQSGGTNDDSDGK